ncbi:formyltetrahydrofolate deformylase [Thalassotalea aquiviva]|uniref:formyltetrahydrofolate deformylase n=1 Tax=Thalassotalea aquiviva TaxID=3242415 RepID=UPI00352ADF0F
MRESPSSGFNQFILKLKCPDRLGVMARITAELFQQGAFINDARHYADPQQQIFNMRIEYDDRTVGFNDTTFRQAMADLARELEITYHIRRKTVRPKIVVAVSKEDHCLSLLLTKYKSGVLNADIVAVISNHQNCRDIVEFHQIPFYFLPINKDGKSEQEQKLMQIFQQQKADLLVLARYMQILSNDLCEQLQERAINIHHSFLPGFKGANPYQQAHDRGVKIIGATAHFVTADLDEGPIIVQEVKPVDHATTVQDMKEIGHDIEATALARAVRYFVEDRILLNGDRTVIL